ncbi:class I SAM-dependent methyltransferase [Paenibacillus sp. N1-5-1-14]|uniref:class I SAM-dependent methyltransferase n=1 Tax=Paenibacillus radicibacter TaxID=2972488 RepID=UPI002158EAC1|nr:class I SAM-dependent methyltransferase [Paenibacillus radicibacter]MCR8642780.1 class I SAM-dependent methyltransferase [Paenibacillus radicibacter]
MRQSIKDFVQICAETLPWKSPVYEFGAYQCAGQEGFANLRPLFSNVPYVGCDMRPGPGVDMIQNLHAIDLPTYAAGTVISLDTMEHVEYPHLALRECHRILQGGGVCIISSVMNFPIHDYPSDYWRFTPEGFRSLLSPFETILVDSAGQELHPHTVIGVGIKGSVHPSIMAVLQHKLQYWKSKAYIDY